MRFKANLIHPDEVPLSGDAEDELPADLTLLGAQLRDDADRLAMCYPATHAAGQPNMAASQQPQLGGARPAQVARGRRYAAAYGVLVMALLSSAGSIAVLSIVPQREPAADASATGGGREAGAIQNARQSPAGDAQSTIAARKRTGTIADSPLLGRELMPAAFLLEASEPEMEALLDLREYVAPQRTKISI